MIWLVISIACHSFPEDFLTPPQIVTPDSSGVDHQKERKIPIEDDHMNMCRFRFSGDTFQAYEEKVRFEVRRYVGLAAISNTVDGSKQ